VPGTVFSATLETIAWMVSLKAKLQKISGTCAIHPKRSLKRLDGQSRTKTRKQKPDILRKSG
jgi:hypothetical protein